MANSNPMFGASPLGVALKVALVVLGGEFAIMVAIDGVLTPIFGATVSDTFWEFLDPVLLCFIAAPALHFFVLRPMRAQQTLLEKQRDELGIAAVTFNSQDGVIVTDAHHTILRVNSSFSAITGFSSDDAIGKTPAILHSGKHDQEFYRQMRETLAAKKYWQGEIWNRRKNGEVYPEWLTITAVTGEKGNIHYVGIFSDITKRKTYEEKINFLAYHDRLTELPSRELFYDRLSVAMSGVRRKQDRLALLFLDLDGFKDINDTFGHEAGDEVLRTTSTRLLGCMRQEDTAARLGGDEFAVVVNGIEGTADVERVSEKIIGNLSEPISLRGERQCSVGVSIGIAVYPENGAEIDTLMSAADRAMYRSKAAGKNRYSFSDERASLNAAGENWIVLGDAYMSGISEFDLHHLLLAAILNELHDAVVRNEPAEVTAHLLSRLTIEIQTHFGEEDRWMADTQYDDGGAHLREHERLIEDLEGLKTRFYKGGEMAVLHALKEWLLSHISTYDKFLSGFILRTHQRKHGP